MRSVAKPHHPSGQTFKVATTVGEKRSHRDKSHPLDELDTVHHFFGLINLPDEQQARDDFTDAAGLLS